MALSVRDFIAQLIGHHQGHSVERHDSLVTLVPARPVRQGIPDEYMERHPDVPVLMGDQTPATKTSPVRTAPLQEHLLRETLPALPYSL
jgi:hypothetical protein